MPLFSEHRDFEELSEQLRDTPSITAELMSAIIHKACRRFPSIGQSIKTAQIYQLINSGAWTDVVLALINLELPQWRVRRIAYDEGEWHCALSRERELPDWLDQSVEARHADLALAIMSALVEVQRLNVTWSRTSVPAVSRDTDALYEPLCSENFG
jgi:hypothetical protein